MVPAFILGNVYMIFFQEWKIFPCVCKKLFKRGTLLTFLEKMSFLLGSEKSGNEAMLAESVECSENIAKVRANRRAQQVNSLEKKFVRKGKCSEKKWKSFFTQVLNK